MKFTTSFFALLATVAQLSVAAPSTLETRDLFVPPVVTPDHTTVWTVGKTESVTWDVSGAPENITNKFGRIYLMKSGVITDTVLADGFDLLAGSTDVTVPEVDAADDYQVLLFGDSSNWSEVFTINA